MAKPSYFQKVATRTAGAAPIHPASALLKRWAQAADIRPSVTRLPAQSNLASEPSPVTMSRPQSRRIEQPAGDHTQERGKYVVEKPPGTREHEVAPQPAMTDVKPLEASIAPQPTMSHVKPLEASIAPQTSVTTPVRNQEAPRLDLLTPAPLAHTERRRIKSAPKERIASRALATKPITHQEPPQPAKQQQAKPTIIPTKVIQERIERQVVMPAKPQSATPRPPPASRSEATVQIGTIEVKVVREATPVSTINTLQQQTKSPLIAAANQGPTTRISRGMAVGHGFNQS